MLARLFYGCGNGASRLVGLDNYGDSFILTLRYHAERKSGNHNEEKGEWRIVHKVQMGPIGRLVLYCSVDESRDFVDHTLGNFFLGQVTAFFNHEQL